MSFFSLFRKSRYEEEIPEECLYDPYYDLESNIVGEVQRIIKDGSLDDLPDYIKIVQDSEDERKHLLKLLEIAQACDEAEIIVLMKIARDNFPDLWHKINYEADCEQRKMLEKYEKVRRDLV